MLVVNNFFSVRIAGGVTLLANLVTTARTKQTVFVTYRPPLMAALLLFRCCSHTNSLVGVCSTGWDYFFSFGFLGVGFENQHRDNDKETG